MGRVGFAKGLFVGGCVCVLVCFVTCVCCMGFAGVQPELAPRPIVLDTVVLSAMVEVLCSISAVNV